MPPFFFYACQHQGSGIMHVDSLSHLSGTKANYPFAFLATPLFLIRCRENDLSPPQQRAPQSPRPRQSLENIHFKAKRVCLSLFTITCFQRFIDQLLFTQTCFLLEGSQSENSLSFIGMFHNMAVMKKS